MELEVLICVSKVWVGTVHNAVLVCPWHLRFYSSVPHSEKCTIRNGIKCDSHLLRCTLIRISLYGVVPADLTETEGSGETKKLTPIKVFSSKTVSLLKQIASLCVNKTICELLFKYVFKKTFFGKMSGTLPSGAETLLFVLLA